MHDYHAGLKLHNTKARTFDLRKILVTVLLVKSFGNNKHKKSMILCSFSQSKESHEKEYLKKYKFLKNLIPYHQSNSLSRFLGQKYGQISKEIVSVIFLERQSQKKK